MKSKEEILDEHCKHGMYGIPSEGYDGPLDNIYKAMQEYADQQTEELQKRVRELEEGLEEIIEYANAGKAYVTQIARKLLNK